MTSILPIINSWPLVVFDTYDTVEILSYSSFSRFYRVELEDIVHLFFRHWWWNEFGSAVLFGKAVSKMWCFTVMPT